MPGIQSNMGEIMISSEEPLINSANLWELYHDRHSSLQNQKIVNILRPAREIKIATSSSKAALMKIVILATGYITRKISWIARFVIEWSPHMSHSIVKMVIIFFTVRAVAIVMIVTISKIVSDVKIVLDPSTLGIKNMYFSIENIVKNSTSNLSKSISLQKQKMNSRL